MSRSTPVTSAKATEIPEQRVARSAGKLQRRVPGLAGSAFLLLTLGVVLYGLYVYHFKTVLTMRLPEHEPLAVDLPPVELTSFQVRAGGELLTPTSIAIAADTIYIAFAGKPLIHLYSGELKLLKRIELNRPEPVFPTAITVADSLLIVADSSKQAIAVYDHEGYYLTSSAWYPQSDGRINPRHVSSNLGMLTLTDSQRRRVSLISLVDQQPFYTFLELIRTIPVESMAGLPAPGCAIMTPDSNIWIGDVSLQRAFIFTPSGRILKELEQPRFSQISQPSDFACMVWDYHSRLPAVGSAHAGFTRVHMVDRDAGKVFVYDLSGRLTLVYPRERELQSPLSIAINTKRRQIYLAEAADKEVTVFGY